MLDEALVLRVIVSPASLYRAFFASILLIMAIFVVLLVVRPLFFPIFLVLMDVDFGVLELSFDVVEVRLFDVLSVVQHVYKSNGFIELWSERTKDLGLKSACVIYTL